MNPRPKRNRKNQRHAAQHRTITVHGDRLEPTDIRKLAKVLATIATRDLEETSAADDQAA